MRLGRRSLAFLFDKVLSHNHHFGGGCVGLNPVSECAYHLNIADGVPLVWLDPVKSWGSGALFTFAPNEWNTKNRTLVAIRPYLIDVIESEFKGYTFLFGAITSIAKVLLSVVLFPSFLSHVCHPFARIISTTLPPFLGPVCPHFGPSFILSLLLFLSHVCPAFAFSF